MGRHKTNVRKLIAAVAREVDFVNELTRLCKSTDERVKLEALRLAMAYGYGKPAENVNVSGSVDFHAVVAAARARVVSLNAARTIPPSSIPKLIEGDPGAPTSHNLSGKEVASDDSA